MEARWVRFLLPLNRWGNRAQKSQCLLQGHRVIKIEAGSEVSEAYVLFILLDLLVPKQGPKQGDPFQDSATPG